MLVLSLHRLLLQLALHSTLAPRTHRAARRARGRHQSGVEEGLVMRRKG